MSLTRTGTAWNLGTWDRRPVAVIHSAAVTGYVCQRSYKSHGHVAGPCELNVIPSLRSFDNTVCTITQFTNSSRSAFRDVTCYTHHTPHKDIRIISHVIHSIHHTSATHNDLQRHTNVISNYTIDVTLRYFVTLLCTHPGGLAAPYHEKTSSLTPAGPW